MKLGIQIKQENYISINLKNIYIKVTTNKRIVKNYISIFKNKGS